MMKPPPTISSFGGRTPHFVRVNLQSRRNIHTRAIAPALSGQLWHDGSRKRIQTPKGVKNWTGQSTRCASIAAAPAQKSSYGRMPPPAKTSKTTVPAKTSHSTKSTAPVKSSATPTSRTSVVPSTQIPVVRAKENLNPPPFTHAPELDIPTRKADQSFISYIWKAGRSYLTFYKSGVSNVRQTSKLARSLREKAAKQGKEQSDVLTRAEWQIVQRSRKDMLRLPAFGLIFLVFGEWTPLLVMYITPLIPEPCRIPSQVSRDLAKTEHIRHQRQDLASRLAMRMMAQDRRVPGKADHAEGSGIAKAEAIRNTNALQLTHFELLLESARLNCHSRIWDWAMLTPPKFWLMRNVRKKYEYMRTDDRLIERDGGFQAMDKREAERAAIERGFDVVGKREEEVRRSLAMWWRGGLQGVR